MELFELLLDEPIADIAKPLLHGFARCFSDRVRYSLGVVRRIEIRIEPNERDAAIFYAIGERRIAVEIAFERRGELGIAEIRLVC